MSNLAAHARYELERAGMFDKDSDYNGALAPAVMELVETFSKQDFSGEGAMIALAIFNQLIQFKPLTSITSDSSEWVAVGKEITGNLVWQNKRRSTTFSRDGGKTWYDIDDPSLNNGDTWKNG